MKLVDTQLQVYSETGQSLWWMLPLLILCSILALVFLKREKPKASTSAHFLPWTLVLLLFLVFWLAWKPVLTKIETWQKDKNKIVLLDSSKSMDIPVYGHDLSASLNGIFELGLVKNLPKRDKSFADFAMTLRRFHDHASEQLTKLVSLRNELEQQIPLSRDNLQTLAAHHDWLKNALGKLGPGKIAFEEKLASSEIAGSPALTSWKEKHEKFSTSLERLQFEKLSLKVEVINDEITFLEKILKAYKGVPASLRSLQRVLDEKYVETHKNLLADAMKRVSKLTRLDVAKGIADKLKERGFRLVETQNTNSTDLYQEVESALQHAGEEPLSHLVLLSDGAHLGKATSRIANKLKELDFEKVFVGIGRDNPKADLAILELRAPNFVKRRGTVNLHLVIKTPVKQQVEYRVQLKLGSKEIRNLVLTSTGATRQHVKLSFKANTTGRFLYEARLIVDDDFAANNRARFELDVLKKTPKLLLLGDRPDWDSTYYTLALEKLGVETQQLYHGLRKKLLSRGSSTSSVPAKLTQWSRYSAVLLYGEAYGGFKANDAKVLHDYVVKKGGSLIIVHDEKGVHRGLLAKNFAWTNEYQKLERDTMTLVSQWRHVPIVQLGLDGTHSSQIVDALGKARSLHAVPPQHLSLIQDSKGNSLMSLGFYGRGKVIHVGINGIDAIRSYEKAEYVERLLSKLLSAAITPLSADADAAMALYPSLATTDRSHIVIGAIKGAALAKVSGEKQPLSWKSGSEIQIATWVPKKDGKHTFASGAKTLDAISEQAPSRELLFYEYRPDFLKAFASESSGSFIPLSDAHSQLNDLQTQNWQWKIAKRYPLASHWLLLVLMAVTGTAYWALRKITGLAI